MRAAQDWDTVSKSMEGVLEQEAKERALNRDAIAMLRRCGETRRDAFVSNTLGSAAHKDGLLPCECCKA